MVCQRPRRGWNRMRSIVLVMYASAMVMDCCFGFFFGAPTSSGQVTRFLGIARKTTAYSDAKANVEQPSSIRLRSCRVPPFRALPVMATPGADDDARSSIGVSKEIRKDVGVGGGMKSVPAESEKEEMEFKGIWVMMNGVSGKMGAEVAAACLRRGFRIAPYAICGSGGVEVNVSDLEGGNPTKVTAVASDDMEGCEMALAEVRRRCGGGRLIVVDYTHPSVVNANGEFYSKHGLNFVMGTTGGDRDVLLSAVMDGGVYAVIAPNMGKQIVALQSAIDIMAREFPGSFGGYKLEITESHQSWKADTSGTAKALAADFARLTGEDYKVEAIDKVRDPEKQVEFGVPEEYLDGHAFHTYKLLSSDGTAEFQFRHNVCGRRMYAEGTADAVEFLDKKATSMAEKRVYNMLDVLREGGM